MGDFEIIRTADIASPAYIIARIRADQWDDLIARLERIERLLQPVQPPAPLGVSTEGAAWASEAVKG